MFSFRETERPPCWSLEKRIPPYLTEAESVLTESLLLTESSISIATIKDIFFSGEKNRDEK